MGTRLMYLGKLPETPSSLFLIALSAREGLELLDRLIFKPERAPRAIALSLSATPRTRTLRQCELQLIDVDINCAITISGNLMTFVPPDLTILTAIVRPVATVKVRFVGLLWIL
jgi:hypothetical protein